ncbi:Glycerol-3-phosphate acyltransferase [Sodalis praecaptivus]
MNAIAIGMIIFAYLCGSVSSAILICKVARLPDPRTSGSGNPGATNVLRLGGKLAAAGVMVFDILKGMIPVWIGYGLGLPPFWLGLVAIAACLGHIYPVFFHFRGGKGVATALGAIAPIGYDLSGLMIGTWLLTVLLSGYSSLGAIVSALIAPFMSGGSNRSSPSRSQCSPVWCSCATMTIFSGCGAVKKAASGAAGKRPGYRPVAKQTLTQATSAGNAPAK